MRTISGFAFVLVVGTLSTACSGGGGSPTSPTVVVPPTAPIQAPEISQEAKELIQKYNIDWNNRGGSARWARMPVKVWADADLPTDLVQKAADFWSANTEGKISVVVVKTEAESDIPLYSSWPPPVDLAMPAEIGCGAGGPRTYRGNVVIAGYGWLAFLQKPQCLHNNGLGLTIAHELGHAVLALGGHTSVRGDIMGPAHEWTVSPVLMQYINWLYTVPPGTKL